MSGTSQSLRVSYGTFSCTVEGFDDNLQVLKDVVGYFRDLVADTPGFARHHVDDPETFAALVAESLPGAVRGLSTERGYLFSPDDAGIGHVEGPDAIDAAVQRLAAESFAGADASAADEALADIPRDTIADALQEIEADAPQADSDRADIEADAVGADDVVDAAGAAEFGASTGALLDDDSTAPDLGAADDDVPGIAEGATAWPEANHPEPGKVDTDQDVPPAEASEDDAAAAMSDAADLCEVTDPADPEDTPLQAGSGGRDEDADELGLGGDDPEDRDDVWAAMSHADMPDAVDASDGDTIGAPNAEADDTVGDSIAPEALEAADDVLSTADISADEAPQDAADLDAADDALDLRDPFADMDIAAFDAEPDTGQDPTDIQAPAPRSAESHLDEMFGPSDPEDGESETAFFMAEGERGPAPAPDEEEVADAPQTEPAWDRVDEDDEDPDTTGFGAELARLLDEGGIEDAPDASRGDVHGGANGPLALGPGVVRGGDGSDTSGGRRRDRVVAHDSVPEEAVDRLMHDVEDRIEAAESKGSFNALQRLRHAVKAVGTDRDATDEDEDDADADPSVAPREAYDDAGAVAEDDDPVAEGAARAGSDGAAVPDRPSRPRLRAVEDDDDGAAPMILASSQRVDGPGPRTATPEPDLPPPGGTAAALSALWKQRALVSTDDRMMAAAALIANAPSDGQFTRPEVMELFAEASSGPELPPEERMRAFGLLLRHGRIRRAGRGVYALSQATAIPAE